MQTPHAFALCLQRCGAFSHLMKLPVLTSPAFAVTSFCLGRPDVLQRRCVSTSFTLCAGHSKWQNIRHIKAAKDQERARLNQRRVYEIRRAIKDGGGNTNPVANSHLAAAIDRAKQDGVPMATIQGALKKAEDKDDAKPYALEARGLSGSYFIIEVITNNLRRTKQTLQPSLNKCKVAWGDSAIRRLFDHKGLVKAQLPQELRQAATPVNNAPSPIDLDMLSEKVLDYAIEVGAEDAGVIEEEVEEEPRDPKAPSPPDASNLALLAWFQCNPDDVNHVRTKVAAKGFQIVFAEAIFTPLSRVVLDDEKNAALITKFLELVADHEDVVKVHDNIDWDPSSS